MQATIMTMAIHPAEIIGAITMAQTSTMGQIKMKQAAME